MNKKLDWVDSIRGYAVLGVLLVHSLQGEKNIMFHNLLNLGAKGVQLFYMASAFTLFYSFNNRKNQETEFTENFFIRRFFRIAPMFYLAILYYLIQNFEITYPKDSYQNVTSLSIITHFLFIHGLSPFWQDSVVPGGWSVGVEFIFYFLCPFLFIWVSDKNKSVLLYILSVYLGVVITLYLQKNPLIPYNDTWKGYLYGYFPAQANVFMLGVVFYFFYTESFSKTFFVFLKILFFISPILILYFLNIFNSGLENNIIITLTFFWVFYILNNVKLQFVVNQAICYLGKISFSVYLIHFSIIYWLKKYEIVFYEKDISINYFFRLLTVLLVSVILSSITYNFIEQPLQLRGKKIINRKEKKTRI